MLTQLITLALLTSAVGLAAIALLAATFFRVDQGTVAPLAEGARS